jgi:hypothetical protein
MKKKYSFFKVLLTLIFMSGFISMFYASPYVTGDDLTKQNKALINVDVVRDTLTAPTNLEAELDEISGEVELTWDYVSGDGFNENFEDGVADNWVPVTGNWTVANNFYQVSNDSYKYTSSYYDNEYSNYEYEVKMRKNSGSSNLMGLWFNGDPTVIDPDGKWMNGYRLVIGTSSDWQRWCFGKYVNGNFTYLNPWETSPDLIPGYSQWNVLKVVFSDGYIDIFFNGVLQGTYFDDTFLSGKVGVLMYDSGTNGQADYDYAVLNPMADNYTFGKVEQNVVRNIYSAESEICDGNSLNGEIIGIEKAPEPVYGNQYTYNIETLNRDLLGFKVYRDGSLLDSTVNTIYNDFLPDYGTYQYEVTAYYPEGESDPAGPVIVFWDYPPDIYVNPGNFSVTMLPDQTFFEELEIGNNGQGELEFDISIDYISGTETVNTKIDYSILDKLIDNSKAEINNIATQQKPLFTDEIWDIQFMFDQVSAAVSQAGVETDGEYIFTSVWNAADFLKFDLEGNHLETFQIAGAANIRDLAYDGEYFYGGSGTAPIFQMDFESHTLIGQINFSADAGRAIAYDDEFDAFWTNNWSSDIVLIDRSGGVLNSIGGSPSIYGLAYDEFSEDGPFLWLFEGTSSGGGCWVSQWAIETGAATGVTHSVSGDMGADAIAGGLALQEEMIPGTYTLLCLGQGVAIIGYELGDYNSFDWLSVNPSTGIVEPGNSEFIEVTFNSVGLTGVFYEANIVIESNDPDQPEIIVPVSMIVIPILPHWEFEGGDPSSPLWTIYIAGATCEGEDLIAGDQIAIFDGDLMVGLFTLDQICTPENQFENDLTAFSVLVSTPGYQAGNPYLFKCWDASEDLEADNFEIELFDPYGDAYTGDVFPSDDGEYSIVTLDFFASSASQTFDLSYGFQFISSGVIPENPDMLIVMAEILNDNLDFARNSQGQTLRKIGPNWVNGIGDWIVDEGYLVKMFAGDSFTINGLFVDPTTPIPVETGFQFVSYFPENPMNALDAFATIIGDDLDFIRNSQGQTLRKIGPNWVNGIGDCQPGEGYLVKMFAAGEIIYPVSAKSSGKIIAIPMHFIFKGGNPAEEVYTLYIKGLEIGDEVAAFDGDKMIGAIRINSQNAYENELPVFSTLTSGVGYEHGNPITFKVWSENNIVSADFTMEAIYDSYVSDVYPAEDGKYSIVNITKASLPEAEEIIKIYPNPATNKIIIQSSNEINGIVITNCVGQILYNEPHNNSIININTESFESGIYLIRIESDNSVLIKKIIIE